MASFRDNITITTGSTVTQMTPMASTSNYVVQLDPVSGHFEIVDSTLANPSSRPLELSSENDEAVYKIRDEDFGGTMMDQNFSEIVDMEHDINSMNMNDLFSRSYQYIHQDTNPHGQPQQFINLNIAQQNYTGFEEISSSERETVQQAIDEVYTSGNLGITNMSMPMTNLIQSGQQLLQVDNNFIICSAPINQSINVMTGPVISSPIQYSQPQQMILMNNPQQFPQFIQSSPVTQTPEGTFTILQSHQPDMRILAPPQPQLIVQDSVETVCAPVNQIFAGEISTKSVAEDVSKTEDYSVLTQNVTSSPMEVQHSEPKTTDTQEFLYEIEEETKTDDEDDDIEFDIKIVSCTSTNTIIDSAVVEPQVPNPVDEGENVPETLKEMDKGSSELPENNDLIMDSTLSDVKEDEEEVKPLDDEQLSGSEMKGDSHQSTTIDHELEKPAERTPTVPHLLSSYVDKDDELLIAFKNRKDLYKTEICVYCYSWFDDTSELDDHIAEAHLMNPVTHKCGTCDAIYFARILKLRHEKLHKYDMKYRSHIYLQNTSFKSHFTKRFRPAQFSEWYHSHLTEVCDLVDKLSFECFDCGLLFPSEDILQHHYERYHALQLCGLCGKDFDKWTQLRQHEREFHGIYSISENYIGGAWNLWDHWYCEESLEKDAIMSNVAFFHDYRKRSSDETPVFEEAFIEDTEEEEPPDECDSSHMDISEGVLDNVVTAEPPNLRPLVHTKGRKRAARSSSNGSSPRKQIRTIERSLSEGGGSDDCSNDNGEYLSLPFKCDLCQKSYDNEHDLKRHAKCHSSEKHTLACQFCGKIFKTHSHKKEHERTHTGEKPYECPICSRSFIQSSNLKKHIQTHKSQNTLQCLTCGKQFIKEASLVLHQRAHAQDRKFRCEVCDRAYNYASLLKRHMRIHTGEMPYSCESCGMLFHELVSLHYHRKKVHTGERPHKCATCGRAFILSSDLKKHVQIHLKPATADKLNNSKAIRRRSQSKSSEKTPECDTDASKSEATDISEVVDGTAKGSEPLPPQHLNSIPEDEDSDDNFETSLEESIVNEDDSVTYSQADQNKPTILRVYKRRETKTEIIETQSEAPEIIVTTAPTSLELSSIPPLISNSQSQPHHDSSEDMLLRGEYTHMMDSHPINTKSIDEVLQLTNLNAFGDFDMNNIIVVPPEASSEIEIIIEDQNQHGMQ